MKSSHQNEPRPPSLEEWRLNPPGDPEFRPAVWRRIQKRARETWTAYVRAHLVGWAVAGVMLTAGAGWTGHTFAQARLEAAREKMVVAYLAELDPRVLAKLPPSAK